MGKPAENPPTETAEETVARLTRERDEALALVESKSVAGPFADYKPSSNTSTPSFDDLPEDHPLKR